MVYDYFAFFQRYLNRIAVFNSEVHVIYIYILNQDFVYWRTWGIDWKSIHLPYGPNLFYYIETLITTNAYMYVLVEIRKDMHTPHFPFLVIRKEMYKHWFARLWKF